jgi:dTDP-4-amino-4,6-dideoxygalactose transaminase
MLIGEPNPHFRTAYERSLADRVGAAHAVAFGYARTGLSAIFTALGLKPGDEVVLSPLTCKVIPLTLISLKLRPVYADVSPETLNLWQPHLSAAIGPGTRAILFQHTYGNPAGVASAARIAAKHGLPLIEDCAQSLPHTRECRAPGSTGIAAIFSNNLLKPLPAGSGGAVVTNDLALSKELRRIASLLPTAGFSAMARLRLEAWLQRRVLRPELYWLALRCFGRNHERPVETEIASEITAAAGLPGDYQMREGVRWLEHVEEWSRQRMECCESYLDLLAGCNGLRIPGFDIPQPLYYFPIRTRHKREVLEQARRQRVELIAWPDHTPIYPVKSAAQLSAYGFDPAQCPLATTLAGELIGLPTHNKITEQHRRQIVNLLRSYQ